MATVIVHIGVTVQGRHLFDLTNGWEARPPAGDRVRHLRYPVRRAAGVAP